MNILHLYRSPLAGAPGRICSILNNNGIPSRSLGCSKPAKTPYVDILWEVTPSPNKVIQENPKQLDELLSWCDIVHIHNQPPFPNDGDSWKLLQRSKRPIVFQIHSEPHVVKGMLSAVSKKVKVDRILCIAQYQAVHLQQDLDFVPVRNGIDIYEDIYQTGVTSSINRPPHVTFSPSNTMDMEKVKRKRNSQWAYKAHSEVKDVLERLTNKGKITHNIYTGIPFHELMHYRAKGDIHIDDVFTGSYHLSSLEGLAQGKATIANIAPWMEKYLKKFIGCEDLPWIKANSSTLENCIANIVVDEEKLKQMKVFSRQWMEEHWNPRKVVKDYNQVYEGLV